MITAAEREAALRRAAAKRVLRTRFIANSVPPHVLRWLIAHEEAVMVGGAAPAMPHDVLDWFGARGIPFAGNGDEAGMREVAFRVPVDAPRQLSHTCGFCGGSFEAKRRDATFLLDEMSDRGSSRSRS